ncbi:hypothetical protein EXIGLDRAFT_782728 [Exidia glandulosa HHB12029]|uniref:Uncharacterized protein n=1 Tax=Exidia glandulosa HHB12029 TaxID=1314781 RepID=A0A166NH46_EXIGL|nr:hypothetical protein EXIGLDRAFT_782728 [Exidia glandulosa HHB12029]
MWLTSPADTGPRVLVALRLPDVFSSRVLDSSTTQDHTRARAPNRRRRTRARLRRQQLHAPRKRSLEIQVLALAARGHDARRRLRVHASRGRSVAASTSPPRFLAHFTLSALAFVVATCHSPPPSPSPLATRRRRPHNRAHRRTAALRAFASAREVVHSYSRMRPGAYLPWIQPT